MTKKTKILCIDDNGLLTIYRIYLDLGKPDNCLQEQ